MPRTGSSRYDRFKKAARRSGVRGSVDKEKATKTDIAAIKLGISICIFLLDLAVKMIFPEFTAKIKDKALATLNADVDYKAAVTAFSDGITGKSEFSDAVAEAFSYITGDKDVSPVVSQDGAIGGVNNDNLDEVDTSADDLTSKKEEMVSAYLESKSEYSSLELPSSTTYQMPDLNIEYVSPANGEITSTFGYREHPEDGEVKFHYGLDIGCAEGTDIAAFADGEVTAVTDSASYGLNVIITHENGVETRYAHCSEILVEVGDTVKKGDVIAKSGQTGNATGPCLHFEVKVSGVYVNPEYYLSLL